MSTLGMNYVTNDMPKSVKTLSENVNQGTHLQWSENKFDDCDDEFPNITPAIN